MYIRNYSKKDLAVKHNGKHYIFSADSTIPLPEDLPYAVIEAHYPGNSLVLIEDEHVELKHNPIGSNFDDFLIEEGILEEVEQRSKEVLNNLENGICLGGIIPVEGAKDLPSIEEIKEEGEEENGKQEETSETATSETTNETSSTKTATEEKEKVDNKSNKPNGRRRRNR